MLMLNRRCRLLADAAIKSAAENNSTRSAREEKPRHFTGDTSGESPKKKQNHPPARAAQAECGWRLGCLGCLGCLGILERLLRWCKSQKYILEERAIAK
jgi:hypothetical protein